MYDTTTFLLLESNVNPTGVLPDSVYSIRSPKVIVSSLTVPTRNDRLFERPPSRYETTTLLAFESNVANGCAAVLPSLKSTGVPKVIPVPVTVPTTAVPLLELLSS